jgi:superfamily II helicase
MGMNPAIYHRTVTKMQAVMAGECEHCGASWDYDLQPVVEAFEISGELVCEECAEAVFEDNGQFGVGA